MTHVPGVREEGTNGSPAHQNVEVNATGDPTADIEPARARLDRPVHASNLASGALWLLVALLPWNGSDYDFESLPLFLIPASYIVAGSLFLGAVYGRATLTKRQEAMAWTAP